MQAVIDFFVMINVYFLDAVNSVFPDAQLDEIYFNTLAITAFVTWLLYVIRCFTHKHSNSEVEALVADKRDRMKVIQQRHEDNYYRELGRLTDQVEELEDDLATARNERSKELFDAKTEIKGLRTQLAEANEVISKISSTGQQTDGHKLERVIVSLMREDDGFDEIQSRAQRIVEALED